MNEHKIITPSSTIPSLLFSLKQRCCFGIGWNSRGWSDNLLFVHLNDKIWEEDNLPIVKFTSIDVSLPLSLSVHLCPHVCVLYYTILYYTIPYYTKLYYIILYYTILCHTLQFCMKSLWEKIQRAFFLSGIYPKAWKVYLEHLSFQKKFLRVSMLKVWSLCSC